MLPWRRGPRLPPWRSGLSEVPFEAALRARLTEARAQFAGGTARCCWWRIRTPRCASTVRRCARTTPRCGCPALPLRHRHEYAADFPRGLPAGDLTPHGSRPPTRQRRPGVHRCPAHIRQVGAGASPERRYTLAHHVHLFVSLGRPRPSGSADPSRRCQGCSHPPRRLPVQAALSFTSLLRQTGDGVLPPPSGDAAPRGARRPKSRRWTGPPRSCRCARGSRRIRRSARYADPAIPNTLSSRSSAHIGITNTSA